ncbi:TOPZ1 protein, partial [Rhinopomastus cyanomelas]|nr:TOPZ1 protein [Rhinopomastus cyanomelas]
LQKFTCQRAVPMAGKRVWPLESCARTSVWAYKHRRPASERKRSVTAACEESSGESSIHPVGNSAATRNLRCWGLHVSAVEMKKESACKTVALDTECPTLPETPESSALFPLRTSDENAKLPVNTEGSAVTLNHDDVREVKATQKHETKGTATTRNLSETVWSSTSTENTNSPRASVVNQTALNLKLMKLLSTGNPAKFKIPLRRNKPESKQLEPASLFESKSCGPFEFLDSINVARRQETGMDTSLVSAEQQAFPVGSDAVSAAAMKKEKGEMNSKDFQHDSSESLLEEMSLLSESCSLCLQPFCEEQLESSVPDFTGTECALKSDFPDASWNAGDPPAAGESNSENKSRGDLPQQKSQHFPDILEAFEEDALIIDVIEDDPDLFGTSNEEEHAPTDSESCPSQAPCAAICIPDEEQELKPKCPVISEGSSSVHDSFRYGCKFYYSNPWCFVLDQHEHSEDMKTHSSSRGSSPLGGVSEDFLEDGQRRELDELMKSFEMDKKVLRHHPSCHQIVTEITVLVIGDCECKDLVKSELLSVLPLHGPKVYVLSEATPMKPQTNDYRVSGKCPSVPGQNLEDLQPWKMEKAAVIQQILETIELPPKYCRYYFTTLRGCDRSKCWFWHVPEQGDERVCMAILRTYIGVKESGLLKRAVQIFVKYYREDTASVDLASQVLNDLLMALLKNCLLQEVFQILNVAVRISTLPAVDVLLSVFKHVAALNRRDAVLTLISTFCKLVDAGMFLQSEHFDCIVKFLQQLQVSSQHMSTVLNMKSRFQVRHSEKGWLFDFSLAVAEIQHCKERSDWTKLGALYVNARTGCERFHDLQKLSLSVVEVLTRDSDTDRAGVPFCDFADAVMKHSKHNEADKVFVGRTGISVMCFYHRGTQWIKGRKVLDKMHELQIHFTVLKGLTDAERLVSRCQIVNTAAEIFLKTGSLDGATWVLRESEWTINSPLWPCKQVDILNRHNLLCKLEHQFLRKSLYRQALEVLQNLPGFQSNYDTIDVSQYSCLFNNLINACFESKNLGVSSSAVDFMLSKKITVDCVLLRGLITALGRSSLWSKARTYYKSALSLGYYPAPHGNISQKRLMIPSYLSEVEMLLAIEIFLVSNASEITSPMAVSPTLQIILKRCEDQAVQNSCDYQTAAKRLVLAARLSDPKLSLRHMTMNVNMEEVYSLELMCAQIWLQENMKWAGKVWLFQ